MPRVMTTRSASEPAMLSITNMNGQREFRGGDRIALLRVLIHLYTLGLVSGDTIKAWLLWESFPTRTAHHFVEVLASLVDD